MSGVAILVSAYFAVALPLIYVGARVCGDYRVGAAMLCWPLFLPALFFAWLAGLGERHGQ